MTGSTFLAATTRRWLLAVSASALLAGTLPAVAEADQVNVAVAANFTEAAEAIGEAFATATRTEVIYSFGSTGQLYTQIGEGAPFEVFLSADRAHPQKAVDEGLGVDGTVFTYAAGKLVLFSIDAGLVTGEDTLHKGLFEKIAIANPETAPYGAAAIEVMQNLAVLGKLEPKIVMGENINQAYQFVDTHNAEVGFVALSQVIDREDGSRWEAPQDLYAPIAQDAVLLTNGADNPAAAAYLAFLQSPEALAIIESYGYATGH